MNTQIYTKLISDFYITIFLLFEKLNSQEYSLYFDYFLSMIVYVRYVHWSTVLIKIKYISWSVSDWLVVYIYLVPQGSGQKRVDNIDNIDTCKLQTKMYFLCSIDIKIGTDTCTCICFMQFL